MKKALLCLALSSVSSLAWALPFDIVYSPGQPPIPTTIVPGQTITVFYTVTNNTGSTRNNNFIGQFPSNTSQVTGPGLCGSTFNLAPGASCILQLSISGPTNGCNPPLLACFQGGLTCSGTEGQLDVNSVSSTDLRAVTGGNASPAVESIYSNVVQISLDGPTDWSLQLPGIPASATTSASDCVGIGSTAACTLGGYTGSQGFVNQSFNGGLTWATVTGLTGLTGRFINGVACTDGGICIAAGDNGTNTGYMAVSTGTPGIWTDAGFSALTNRTLADAACAADGSICIAVGEDTLNNTTFIYQSITPATPANWIAATTSPLTFQDKMKTASCTEDGELCVAAGGDDYNTDVKIMQTTDQGVTWEETHSGSVVIEDSSCTGSGANGWCVAVGKNSNDPRIFFTTDSGTIPWNSIDAETGTQYDLLGVSCTGTTSDGLCITVGNNTNTNEPFILRSPSPGTSWTIVSNANISGLPASTTLSDVSCTGDFAPFTCVAVGRDSTNNRSMIIKSTDSGNNWVVDTTGPVSGGNLSTVSITGG